MADIFISYKKEDAGRVNRIVEGLRAEGFTVWWDHAIAPGAQWDQTIQQELKSATMVIAVWSQMSVDAPWVKEEAAVGKQKGRLLPVRIDNVDPPLGFGLIQMADLVGWDGDRKDDPQWSHFLSAVKAVLSGEPVTGLERPLKRRSNATPWMAGLAAAVIVLAGAGYFAWTQISDISSVEVSRDETGSTTTVTYDRSDSGTAPAAPADGAVPATPSAAEQAMFEKAQGSRLKTDYQDYLRSFPEGVYARQIRENILTLCESKPQKVWKKQGPFGQWQRAMTTMEDATGKRIIYPTSEPACESAKKNFEIQVDGQCRNFAAAAGRNPELKITWAKCECTKGGDSWYCQNDSTYACTWEQEIEEYVDVCG